MVLERVNLLRDESGIKSYSAIESACGLGKNIIGRWDTNTPAVDKVCAVADFFGVSVDYLCGRTDEREVNDGSAISRDDRKILDDIRRLNAYDRETVLDLIARELARPAPARVLTLPRSLQAASAGVGVPLEDDAFENITVADTPSARRAAFALPVTGDSMEPLYHDGDVVLVEATPDVEEGEIGVFYIDGRGYLKKRGADCLISLNDKYEPIPLSASSRCFGRVIGVLPIADIYI
ncbi:MAG: hypothetical protein IJK23_02525 [Clostridia bacterium]|nr:hypothetical protein [Clostridia bacterium]